MKIYKGNTRRAAQRAVLGTVVIGVGAGLLPVITLASAQAAEVVVKRINAGGGALVDGAGLAWSADSGYTGGGTYTTPSTIAGALGAVYRSERHNPGGYRMPVSNGSYTVRLHAAEIWYGAAGKRVFDVTAEGRTVASGVDVFARAGKNSPYSMDVSVTVVDGELNLGFINRVDIAKVSGIEVIAGAASPAPAMSAPALPAAATKRINAGGGGFTDSNNQLWGADSSFVGGGTYTTPDSVAGPLSAMYRSERHNPGSYRIPVSNGSYMVRLHAAEIWHSAPGKRVFDVLAENRTVASGVDVFSKVGKNSPFVLDLPVTVGDGELTLGFLNRVDGAKVSGIEIVPVLSAPLAAPVPDVTAPVVPSPTVTPAPTPAPAPVPAPTPAPPGSLVTFRPPTVPLSGPELVNPGRGLFKWLGTEWLKQPEASKYVYNRYNWSDIEKSRGVYDWSTIDAELAAAKARGGKFGFRIMSLHFGGPGSAVPSYLQGEAGGFWASDNGRSFWVPDWNSPAYLSRVEAFMAAAGQRYANDPRLGLMDIGFYGNWGEWHTWPLSYPRGSLTTATPATQKRLIDAQINAMPNKRWLMLHGNNDVQWGVEYAMGLRHGRDQLAVGWRNDSFGQHNMDGMRDYDRAWAKMKEQWRVAPAVGEYAGIRPGDGKFVDAAVRQTREYHVAMQSNGNMPIGPENYSQAERDAMQLAAKLSGFRFQLEAVTAPTSITRGTTFSLAASWRNVGVTPAYEPWLVTYQLRNRSTGTVAWQSRSGLDLQKFLPGSQVQTDALSVPASLATGEYDLTVVTVDRDAYYAPLQLALQNRLADGAYRLGAVTVR